MLLLLFPFLVWSSLSSSFLDCHNYGVDVCGLLILETGQGSGTYSHKDGPVVHGLWPQVPPYGTSQCVPPSLSDKAPSALSECYTDMKFEQHEWEAHGLCAGVEDAEDFFENAVCLLSSAPLYTMKKAMVGNFTLEGVAKRLDSLEFPVYALDLNHSQILLSACRIPTNRTWVLAPLDQFASRCAGG